MLMYGLNIAHAQHETCRATLCTGGVITLSFFSGLLRSSSRQNSGAPGLTSDLIKPFCVNAHGYGFRVYNPRCSLTFDRRSASDALSLRTSSSILLSSGFSNSSVHAYDAPDLKSELTKKHFCNAPGYGFRVYTPPVQPYL